MEGERGGGGRGALVENVTRRVSVVINVVISRHFSDSVFSMVTHSRVVVRCESCGRFAITLLNALKNLLETK